MQFLRAWMARRRAMRWADAWRRKSEGSEATPGPLRQLFDAGTDGPVWKWLHYLDAYDRHFSRFRGKEVHILEIGVLGGGSLGMWQTYFGPQCRVYGVDIDPACRQYERDGIRIFTGDQKDRAFWESIRKEVPVLDIVIDDGGHHSQEQIVSLQELLPHLRPGGVYVTEDIQGHSADFIAFMEGLTRAFHARKDFREHPENPEHRIEAEPTAFQSRIESITTYPYLTIIETRSIPLQELRAPVRGHH